MPRPRKRFDEQISTDELDLQIVNLFRKDARISNKDVALKLGMSESAIAARIRGLDERGAMRVVALRDIRALGYDLLAHADIFIQGRSATAIADDLAKIDEVAMVALYAGTPQIIVQINARTRHELADVISNIIGRIPGIINVETSISLEIVKFVSELGVFVNS